MTRPPLGDEQSRAAIVSDLDRNLLVEAGAGSGKTHMMAARMAAGIASGRTRSSTWPPSRSRGRRRPSCAADSNWHWKTSFVAASSRRPARSASAPPSSNLERFFAGTIHSFCAHLLRERPVESGLAPGFSELDETEGDELRAEAWRDFLAHARSSGHPLLQELRDAGLKTGQLQNAFETVCDLEDVAFPTGDAQLPDVKAVWRKTDRFWSDLGKLLPTVD